MDRRGFFKLFGLGVAGIALEQAIPLGRVWSFPTEIIVPGNQILTTQMFTREALRILQNNLLLTHVIQEDFREFEKKFAVGRTLQFRAPQRFTMALPKCS